MIVVDTNVVVHRIITGELTAFAQRARARDSEWAAPRLWRSEFRNVLALHVRHRGLAIDEASMLMVDAVDLLAGREYEVDSDRVLRLAAASGRSAFDCEFVAVARDLGVPLVTADRALLASFPDTTIALDRFGA